MTSFARMTTTLALKPVDHVPVVVSPWAATTERWRKEGHIGAEEDVAEHFGQDLRTGGWIDSTADMDFESVVIEETDETILTLDGNGAQLRRHKLHESTPEHVDFAVKERIAWEEKVRPHLLEVDRRRIPFGAYREARRSAAEKKLFFCWEGGAPFEQMCAVCGHEYMLMGMATDPDWVRDMVITFARLNVMHQEVLFAEEGLPNGVFYNEDMGFKYKPFMSPQMYEEIVLPGHKLLFEAAHAEGLKVLVHSCGFVEPLVPGLIEAGMDCLQAMEVKAGMDVLRLFDRFGERISFFGNIDVRTLVANDRAAIEKELLTKIPPIINHGGGYILHSDHSEPPEVDYETMRFFVDRGREIGTPKP